jgi:hypothetical protein
MVRHKEHIKQVTDKKCECHLTHGCNILNNTKNIIKETLNTYMEIITMNFALQTKDNPMGKTINGPNQVKTRITKQSHALLAERPDKKSLISKN